MKKQMMLRIKRKEKENKDKIMKKKGKPKKIIE
jgi:hypothetical protein